MKIGTAPTPTLERMRPSRSGRYRPKARGGSDRLFNLTLACRKCNQAKDEGSITSRLLDEACKSQILKAD
ncbi:MAG: HNH endonuclease [Desulfovibrio sp.]|nr:HNH endonuclease [Desulfovibrio sp.]